MDGKNKKEFMAITVHYIDRNTFENRSNILDVIRLRSLSIPENI